MFLMSKDFKNIISSFVLQYFQHHKDKYHTDIIIWTFVIRRYIIQTFVIRTYIIQTFVIRTYIIQTFVIQTFIIQKYIIQTVVIWRYILQKYNIWTMTYIHGFVTFYINFPNNQPFSFPQNINRQPPFCNFSQLFAVFDLSLVKPII